VAWTRRAPGRTSCGSVTYFFSSLLPPTGPEKTRAARHPARSALQPARPHRLLPEPGAQRRCAHHRRAGPGDGRVPRGPRARLASASSLALPAGHQRDHRRSSGVGDPPPRSRRGASPQEHSGARPLQGEAAALPARVRHSSKKQTARGHGLGPILASGPHRGAGSSRPGWSRPAGNRRGKLTAAISTTKAVVPGNRRLPPRALRHLGQRERPFSSIACP